MLGVARVRFPVFGGSYSGHHGNDELPTIEIVAENTAHPILAGIEPTPFSAGGSLYKSSPLAIATQTLLRGTIPNQTAEPVAWIFERVGGGRSFYTSLGHAEDFDNAAFKQLLFNGLCWGTARESRLISPSRSHQDSADTHWRVVSEPNHSSVKSSAPNATADCAGWYRCYFKLAHDQPAERIRLSLADNIVASVWINGRELTVQQSRHNPSVVDISKDCVDLGELNLLVIRCDNDLSGRLLDMAPVLTVDEQPIILKGRWQFRVGNDPAFASLPLPPKFAASPDVIFFEKTN
jgi:hypothetical protein